MIRQHSPLSTWFRIFTGPTSICVVIALSTALTVCGADTTLPTVVLTSPSSGATLSGAVTLGATASDNVGMASVQFQLDGAALGNAVTGAGPSYVLSWDTRNAADGPHTLAAVAQDTSGNKATTTLSLVVSNQIKLNQRVQTTAAVSVYGSASTATVLGSQPVGALGTVVGGPTSSGGKTWWQITYDNAPSGWDTSDVLLPLPLLNIAPNTWVSVRPTYVGAPNGGQLYPQGWGNKGSYDPASHQIMLSDRWADSVRGFISIFADGIFGFDPVTNVFKIIKLNNWYAQTNANGGYTTSPLPANTTDPTPPDHHPLASVEVIPQKNAVYAVNGVNSISLPDPSILNKTWKLDLGAAVWTMVSSDTTDPNYPPNNPNSPGASIYDPVTNRLVHFVPTTCGCNGTLTYVFDLAANTWKMLPQDPSAVAVNLSGAGITYDTKRNAVIVYGGSNYVGTAPPNAHLWSYSVSQNKWTQLSDAPVAATAPGLSYDSRHDVFLALVGDNTYLYNPNTNTWSQYPATLNRPITMQTWQGVTYNPAYDVFVFEGGSYDRPLVALFRYDPTKAPTLTIDTHAPTVSFTTPANGATVAGTISISANASDTITANTTDSVGVIGLQFQLDGANMSSILSGAGPTFTIGWNTAAVTNGSHRLTAIAYDSVGNAGSSTITVSVNNASAVPILSNVTATSITSTSATINWTTDRASDSQVAYGLTSSYGSLSPRGTTLSTSHSVILSGLASGTLYHFQAMSRDSSGNLGKSTDLTFTTASTALSPLLRLSADAAEVSGITNGSVITPSVGPAGFKGAVVAGGAGSVNFTAAQLGNGVFFLNCCTNTNQAYYKFTGTSLGNIFKTSQGQISFYLKSRYSFSQRQTSAAAPRYSFDVRDNDANNHLFYFQTQVSSGILQFGYRLAGGANQFYYVPRGTEDTLFGLGTTLKVTLSWDGTVSKLYLNDTLVQSVSDTRSTPNWTSASNFDLGAYEYLTSGGYNTNDDIIDEFTVSGPATGGDTTPPTVSMSAPANGATISGNVTISASASDNSGVQGVQFVLDGVNLGSVVTGTGPTYSMTWNTTGAANGAHSLKATATDGSGNSATSASISVTVSNVVSGPVISAVSASSINSSGATINWTTDKASDSQVAYGTTSAYGALTTLNTSLVTAHSVSLSGLAASTTYHFQVRSRDSGGNLTTSGDFSFTTAAAVASPASSNFLQLHGDATEVSGTTNGAVVTPGTAPSGFKGTVVVAGTGKVNFTAAQVGNGVYFQNCCDNTNRAYYKFTGTTVGNIFNVNQGQISFYLKSRYTFSQRQTSAAAPRFAFDVRDNSNHLFYFQTQTSSGRLLFSYLVSGTTQFYYVPQGTEDTLFGSGVVLKVTLAWSGNTCNLYLNDKLVQTGAYNTVVPNWTSASNFDLGAYEYLTYGGYNTNDDIVDEFTVSGP